MLNKIKIAVLSLMWSMATFASTNSKMVWESHSDEISKSISGPMAKIIGGVLIVVAALGWAMTSDSNIIGKGIRIVIALSIVGGVGTLLGFFNLTGGVMLG